VADDITPTPAQFEEKLTFTSVRLTVICVQWLTTRSTTVDVIVVKLSAIAVKLVGSKSR